MSNEFSWTLQKMQVKMPSAEPPESQQGSGYVAGARYTPAPTVGLLERELPVTNLEFLGYKETAR